MYFYVLWGCTSLVECPWIQSPAVLTIATAEVSTRRLVEAKVDFYKVSDPGLSQSPCLPAPWKVPTHISAEDLAHPSALAFHLNYLGVPCHDVYLLHKQLLQQKTEEGNFIGLKNTNTTQIKPKRMGWSWWKEGHCTAIHWWQTIAQPRNACECLWLSSHFLKQTVQLWCPHSWGLKRSKSENQTVLPLLNWHS